MEIAAKAELRVKIRMISGKRVSGLADGGDSGNDSWLSRLANIPSSPLVLSVAMLGGFFDLGLGIREMAGKPIGRHSRNFFQSP